MTRLQKLAQQFRRPGNTDIISRVETFVRGRFQYVGEEIETVRTVERMLDTLERTGKIEGDCDDVCIFIAALFKVLKIPVKFVAIRTTPEEDFLHVFCTVGVQARIIDVTVRPNTILQYYGQPMEYSL